MKSAKILIVFIFLLAFAFQVSAQTQTPKILWKNLQEKYERFEDIKPIIVNKSEKPIYMFADIKLGVVTNYVKLLRFSEENKKWDSFPIMTELPIGMSETKGLKYEKKIMSNFLMIPQQERELNFDGEDWGILTESDGLNPYGFRDNPNYKGKGRYKFQLQFYIDNEINKKIKNFFISESPEFEIIKEQKTFFYR